MDSSDLRKRSGGGVMGDADKIALVERLQSAVDKLGYSYLEAVVEFAEDSLTSQRRCEAEERERAKEDAERLEFEEWKRNKRGKEEG
jgi:hypothetical protein